MLSIYNQTPVQDFQPAFVVIKERRKSKVIHHAQSLEPFYAEKVNSLSFKLRKDAVVYIQNNPFKVASMHEFKAKLEEELCDIKRALKKRNIKKMQEESYDMMVKHFALHILSMHLLEIV